MNAIRFGDQVSLVFTIVMDELSLGLVGDDEEVQAVADRAYWENRGTKATVAMADDVLALIRSFDPLLELKYNKFYIGLAKNGQPNNFAIFRPRKNGLNLEVRLKPLDEVTQELEQVGLDVMDYDKKWSRYRIRLTKADIKKHEEFLQSFSSVRITMLIVTG
jgi:hypothetical protein